MRLFRFSAALASVAALAACAVAPPAGPTIMAAPGHGKSFDAFRTDDYRCRGYASGANGGQDPNQAAVRSGVGTAVAGTAIGAIAGTLLGAAGGSAGAGAAFGAGSGLLLGSAIGAGNAQETGASLQANYDRVYAQCMIASGEDVTPPPAVVVVAPSYPAPYPYYRPGYYYQPGYGPAY